MDTIWEMNVPVGTGFAKLLVIEEEMEKLPTRILCRACGATSEPDRLIVEWDLGSDEIGDFTHGLGVIVAREAVADELIAKFRGLGKRPVQFSDHPKLHRPARPPRKPMKRVWLPYDGPPICQLIFQHDVDLLEESTVTIERRCGVCGRLVYASFDGMEEPKGRGRVRRKPGAGIFVSRSSLAGHDFFKPRDSGRTLVTPAVRKFIERRRFSNIEFLEVGNVVP